MDWLASPDYSLARLLLERGLALTYAVAFLVTANQYRPLLGERGLLPAPELLARTRFWQNPSLFHLRYSDTLLAVVAWSGVGLSLALLAGLPDLGPVWVSAPVWLTLWLLYLSIVNAGHLFYGFVWDLLLVEAGFLAAFLGTARGVPNILVIYLFRWLLFRLEFGAGLIKVRNDRCWRDLTCLDHHHQTQPMPNPLSWYFHHLPKPVHRAEVAGNHLAQLVLPFFLFVPQPGPDIAGGLILVSQAWLVLSGNFAWLNLLTMVLALSAFDDRALHFLPIQAPPEAAPPLWWTVLIIAVTAGMVLLSYWPARNLISRHQAMNARFNPFLLANSYGLFGSVTRERYEVVIEGTDLEGEVPSWREYEFKGKPGCVGRRPSQVAPYHLRLDWQMWFLALDPSLQDRWFLALVSKLLQNDPAITRLLRHNPFPDEPPAAVRARVYHYRFTTSAERGQSGDWWVRTLIGELLPPVGIAEQEEGAIPPRRKGGAGE